MNTKPTRAPWVFIEGLNGDLLIETEEPTRLGFSQRLIQCPGTGGSMSYSSEICRMHWHSTEEWTSNAKLIVAACNAFQTAAERLGCDPIALAERLGDGKLWNVYDELLGCQEDYCRETCKGNDIDGHSEECAGTSAVLALFKEDS